MIKEELIRVKTLDNENVALWKVDDSTKASTEDLFLTHGTFSNKSVLIWVAHYFAERGFTCWIMEWRSHGDSSIAKAPFNFETIALFDFAAVFKYLIEDVGIKKLSCLTHSGGGICLTMFLIRQPEYIGRIKSIVFLGCQVWGASYSWWNFIATLSMKGLSAMLGKVPARIAGAKAHDETYHTMKQWYNWNLNKNFKGKDEFNYLPEMPLIQIPILSICAAGDQFIAPEKGCQEFLDAFKNEINQLICFSESRGHLEDYNHSRVLNSTNAKQEVWPIAFEWIAKNRDV